jgi:bifunctional DNase/RNase
MTGRSYNSQSRPVLARPSVSNAVALADILRCPVVVADQAAGQKDVAADLWVWVSAA